MSYHPDQPNQPDKPDKPDEPENCQIQDPTPTDSGTDEEWEDGFRKRRGKI